MRKMLLTDVARFRLLERIDKSYSLPMRYGIEGHSIRSTAQRRHFTELAQQTTQKLDKKVQANRLLTRWHAKRALATSVGVGALNVACFAIRLYRPSAEVCADLTHRDRKC